MKKPGRGSTRATTLSISLPPELAAAISRRVESGLYGSSSEYVREALRLLLRVEQSEMFDASAEASRRFREGDELQRQGRLMQARRIRAESPELSAEEIEARLEELSDDNEVGPGLRLAPERLRKLKIDVGG